MPVVETVTTPSIWSGVSPACSIADEAASTNNAPEASQVDCVAIVPAVAFLVPVGWSDDVALGDPRIVEHARQPVEKGFLAPECPAPAPSLRPARWFGRDGRCQGKEAADCISGTAFRMFFYTLTHELKRSPLCGYRTGPPGAKADQSGRPALDRNGAGSRHQRMWMRADVRFTCATGVSLKRGS